MEIVDMTRKEIEEAIAIICQSMKGPLPNVERACLHEERKELRAELERRQTAGMRDG